MCEFFFRRKGRKLSDNDVAVPLPTRTQAHYGCRCFTHTVDAVNACDCSPRFVYTHLRFSSRCLAGVCHLHAEKLTYCLCRFMYRNFRLSESESTMYCNHIMCPFNGTNIQQFICIRCSAEFSLRRFHTLHTAEAQVGYDAQMFGRWTVFSRPFARSRPSRNILRMFSYWIHKIPQFEWQRRRACTHCGILPFH